MAASFSDLILSDLFTFHVGTGEKKHAVRVHSRAIAATCDYMRHLIEGSLREAHDRTAEQDVELEDFLRFVEYAYRGDFTVPSCVLEEPNAWTAFSAMGVAQSPAEVVPPTPPPPEDVPEPAAEAPPAADDDWGVFDIKKKKKKEKKPRKVDVLRAEFNKRCYALDPSPQVGFTPISNSAPGECFTPVFLAYARLYCFAEMRLIHRLKTLTLDKLHFALERFTLYPERVGDIIELARYTYGNAPNRTAMGTIDALRTLVVEYIACENAEIGKSNHFKELLEEGGEFVSDFWDVMSKRLM